MLGIGIFISPPVVAKHVADPGIFLLVWLAAGLFALAGAVACGELGAMLPKAGGDYVFQRKAFGPSVAFGSGWVLFGAIFTGSIAAMSVALCEYQLSALTGYDMKETALALGSVEISWAQAAALGLVFFFTFINSMGTRLSAGFQTVMTLVPIGAFTVLAIWAIASDPHPLAAEAAARAGETELTTQGLVMAYMSVYFAYSGWISIIYVSGEVKKPGKNIPRALIGGTSAVTVLYILMCVAFITVLGIPGLREAGEAGTATAMTLAGDTGKIVITLLILCALVASLNGTVLGGARIAYAMAKDGAFWKGVGHVNPKSGTPNRALWLQAIWACVLILSGKFEELLYLVSLAMVITGSLTVASLFMLRRKMPQAERPYKATLYPWLPALYLVSSIFVIMVMGARALGAADPGQDNHWYPLLGLAILCVAFLAHYFWIRRRSVGFLVVAGLLSGAGVIAYTADAASADESPKGIKVTSAQAVVDGAIAARDSKESQAVRQLYEVITCASEAPPVEIERYKRYCRIYKKYVSTYHDKFKNVAGPWISERRPEGVPNNVLYPFSGADLVSSVLAFPDADLHIHLSLEHGGPPDALDQLSAEQRGNGLLKLLESSKGLLNYGDSKTKDLRLAHLEDLPGKLPITLIGLSAHDAKVVSVRYFEILGDGTVHYYTPKEMEGARPKIGHRAEFDARYSNFELAFTLPGSDRLRLMQHVATNLHDKYLGAESGQGIRAWLQGLGRVSFITKAATYLLWSDGFSTIRDIAVEQSEWMISDATGVPTRYLPTADWEVTPYGQFSCDFLNQRRKGGKWLAINNEMAKFWKDNSQDKLAFRFGYIDCKRKNHVMIARRKKAGDPKK